MPAGDIWPTAEQRAERRERLHKKIDMWLDDYIEAENGRWPVITHVHLRQLHEIINKVIDLKFSRDCDGDSVIDYAVADRSKARLAFAVIPHPPEPDAPAIAKLEYQRDINRAQGLLLAHAKLIADQCDTDLSMTLVAERKAETISTMISDLTRLIDQGSTEDEGIEAEKIVYALCGSPIDDFKKRLIDDDDHRNVLLAKWATADFGFVKFRVEQHIARINASLDRLASLPAIARGEMEGETHQVLSDAYKRFGRATFQEQITRFNVLGSEAREARKAARSAKATE